MKFILGKKIGMTQMFDETGKMIPVTLISAGPCEVLQLKTKENDGYCALQIGFEKIEKQNRIKKPQAKKPFKFIKEIRQTEEEMKNFELGKKIDVTTFAVGDEVKVSGISKGKGFQGTVKRHGFKGRATVTHGVKHEMRAPGATGSSVPEHINKGRRMAGHMGVERVSIKNLKIEKVDLENNLLVLKGAVPGRRGTLLEIRA